MDLNNKYMMAGGVAVVIVGAIALILTMKSEPPANFGENAKVDNTKTVKSNVGDKTIGNEAINLEGISAGGDFNLNNSKNKTSTNTNTKADTNTQEEYTEGND
jgi:hypothetical protein